MSGSVARTGPESSPLSSCPLSCRLWGCTPRDGLVWVNLCCLLVRRSRCVGGKEQCSGLACAVCEAQHSPGSMCGTALQGSPPGLLLTEENRGFQRCADLPQGPTELADLHQSVGLQRPAVLPAGCSPGLTRGDGPPACISQGSGEKASPEETRRFKSEDTHDRNWLTELWRPSSSPICPWRPGSKGDKVWVWAQAEGGDSHPPQIG